MGEMHILIEEQLNRESRDLSRAQIEPVLPGIKPQKCVSIET